MNNINTTGKYYSKAFYKGDGVAQTFAVPFPYILKTHVYLYVNGLAQAFTWTAPGTIRVTGTAPNSAVLVEVRRKTPLHLRLVDFIDGSVLCENELDLADTQFLFLLQELADEVDDALKYDKRKDAFDAFGKRITNLADPILDSDAVTYGLLKRVKAELERLIRELEDRVNRKIEDLRVDMLARIRELKDAIDKLNNTNCDAALVELKAYLDTELDKLEASLRAIIAQAVTQHNKLKEIQGGFPPYKDAPSESWQHNHLSSHAYTAVTLWLHTHGGHVNTPAVQYTQESLNGGTPGQQDYDMSHTYAGGEPSDTAVVYPVDDGVHGDMVVLWTGAVSDIPSGWSLWKPGGVTVAGPSGSIYVTRNKT